MANPQTQQAPKPANGTTPKPRAPRVAKVYGTPQQEFKARAERPVRILWKQLENLGKIARSKSACPSDAQVMFIEKETNVRLDSILSILRARITAKPEARKVVEVNLPA